MNKLSRVLISVVFPVATAVAMNADADQKIYPGSLGVKHGGPTPGYYFSAITNPSTSSTMYLDLPAVNDTNGAIESSWVRALDRHYSSNICCSLNTAYWNNTADAIYGSWGASTCSTGSGTDSQSLNTGALAGGSGRHIYFSCSIPPSYNGNASMIISYSVDE